PGFMRIHERTLPLVQESDCRRHLFLAVDRATSWLYMETRKDESPASAAAFLKNLEEKTPFRLRRILTCDRKLFGGRDPQENEFSSACRELGVQQHFYPSRASSSPQPLPDFPSSSMNGSPETFTSGRDIEKRLLSHCYVYNNHIPLRSKGSRTPQEVLQAFYQYYPELFSQNPQEMVAYPDQDKYLFYQPRKVQPTVARAKGIYMWDTTGKRYLDGSSGAVVNNIGHGNKQIMAAIERQSQRTFFAYRTQFENQPSKDLARVLVENTAPHLNRVFYVSGGSEAVESAMKACRQYFFNLGEGSRYKFISRVPSYHGSTLGALALTSYSPLEVAFKPLVADYPKIPAPTCYRCAYHQEYPSCELECAWALEKVILEQGPENIAGFVAEPVGGASTGALVPPDEYFGIIQHICRKYGILLILDEVMTGFGRTGRMFAYEHWGVEADIIALSKGIASGYYPLGAIVTTEEIVDVIVNRGGFAHGHTYAGNPMACTVGLEVINILRKEKLPQNAEQLGRQLLQGLRGLQKKFPMIGDVRGLGLLTALELVRDRGTREPFPPEWNLAMLLTETAFEEGLIIYPRRSINGLFGDHVLVAPPLITTPEQIKEILTKLERSLKRTSEQLTRMEGALGEQKEASIPATPFYR
ncbi:MAG: aminotransferase class III-fold pyridoxal phosphate-dependent enzyme, partial [Desulfonatronovibrionaceae bacterium]